LIHCFLKGKLMKFSPNLKAILDTKLTKKAWAQALLTALGVTLVYKCKRDSNAAAVDPFATGELFYEASLKGPPRISSNSVTNLGSSSNATTRASADLATGKSVLRIEANGYWIEGSLGLLTTACDFRVRQSPSATVGVSLKNVSISPPRHLPSGNGPSAPEPNANSVVAIAIDDMAYPAMPFQVGVLDLTLVREHMVYEDDELSNEMGDIRITQTTNTVIFGQFEFAATRFDMDKALNAEAAVTLEQGLLYCVPYKTWPTYPFADTWRASRDLTYPKAFRARLLRADGSVKKILQMRDGLPINDPSLQFEGWSKGDLKPLRPHWNCGMMLPWQSHLPKVSSNLGKYFNGMVPSSIRHSQAKVGDSVNAAVPLATGEGQVNAQLNWHAAPRWPIPHDIEWGGTPAYNAMDEFDDPWLFDFTRYHGGEGIRTRLSGWDYEPASISQHDHAAFLGGPRHDRSCVSTPLALFATYRDGVRPKGKVPYRQMCDAYGMAMFNMPFHYVQDINRCTGIPTDVTMSGQIAYISGRYTGREDAVTLRKKRVVDLADTRERDGHVHWGRWQQDHLHNSLSPAMWTIMFNSPMHIVSGAMRFAGSVMCQVGGRAPNAHPRNYWMRREHAWAWLQYCVQWKAGTKHFLGIKRADIEKNFQIELERCYDDIYVPTKITNDPDFFFEGLRKSGMHGEATFDAVGKVPRMKSIGNGHDTKVFYLGHMLVMMRQFGLWKVMRAKSEKCRLALDLLIECLDRFSIEAIYHTEGRCSVRMAVAKAVPFDGPDPKYPVDWAEWNTTIFPKVGQLDMVTREDGVVYNGNSESQSATLHLRTQYVMMRSIYFPEYHHPLLAPCQAMIQGFYDKHAAAVAARQTQRQESLTDWGVRWPPQGFIAAPTVLEAFEL
jgi:hypothetical protein